MYGEGNGNSLQYSCLENPRVRGAFWAAIYGVAQSQTWLKWLSSSRSMYMLIPGFPGSSVVKNLPAMQETQVWFLGQEDPFEKERTMHSSILSWQIQWTEEPGGLQSMGSQSQTGLSDWTETVRKWNTERPSRYRTLVLWLFTLMIVAVWGAGVPLPSLMRVLPTWEKIKIQNLRV